MVEYLFFLALALVTPRTMAYLQSPPPSQVRLSCAIYPVEENFGNKELWNGYKVSVGPTAHFEDESGADDACTAALYDSSGRVVYRTTGPGVILDCATGMDILRG